ncbi:MAG: endo-1,4-beta-xylanase [Oscillospiraceae bacterium]|nr:endo-1,4-beta-xylanase [Oscillospiraceae bacterium]
MNSAYSNRIGSEAIQIIGRDGKPAVRRPVMVRQLAGSVLFGCAGFEAVPLVNGELEGEENVYAEARVRKMLDLFNFVTLPFYWGRFEPERGKPDTARLLKTAKWLRERGCAVKGHPLCWHTVTAPWLLELSDGEILEAQLERIRRDVTGFAGVIDIWDVINEAVIMPVFDRYDNGITRICKQEGRAGLVKQVFAEAKRANPGALLLINDFDMSEDYAALIGELLEAGVPIGAIGLQSHMHQGCWSRERTEQALSRFERFGLPLHFTEVNLVSGELMPEHVVDLNDYEPDVWPSTPEGEARQAEEAAEFYKLLFRCPLVEAITYWDFSDGGWLNAPAGLMTKDARVKPAYDALYQLIKNEWRTPDLRVMTDENGYAEITGFRGRYTAEFDGGGMEFTIG